MSNPFSRRSFLRASGTAAGIGFLSGQASAHPAGRADYVVGTATRAARRVARSRAERVGRELDFGSIGSAISGRFPPEAIEALQKRDDIRYVEPDGAVFALGQYLPWGVDRVDADVVHADGKTGAGVDIAIIDTGIDSDHPDLQANLGTGYAVVSCEGSDCAYAWDDDNNHGTHCAGIASAIDNAEGVVGVSTEATLHAVKVLDGNGGGTFSGVAEGIQWVADQGYDVGSMSLGASSGSRTIRDACQYAFDNGVFLVGAAGNSGPCSDCVGYPAAYSTVVAVSASQDSDGLAGYSSTGPEVELIAPGSQIASTLIGGYGRYSGTSMACPHVAGGAAQLLANGYSHTEARTKLQDTAEDLGLAGTEQGHGLLDVDAALANDSNAIVDVRTDSASDVGDTSATLHGTLADLGDSTSADVGFTYHNLDTDSWHQTETKTLSSTGSYEMALSELDMSTSYEFQANGWEADGDTDEGEWVSFTTGSSDTSVTVTTGSASSTGETSTTLEGDLSDLGGAESADCHFEYRETGTSTWSTTTAETLSTIGPFSQDLNELSTGTDYEFRAVADASDGDTDTGSSATFSTSTAETALAVDTDSASSIGETTATLNGSLTDLGGADSVDISFEWGESGGSLSNTTSSQTLSSTDSVQEELGQLSTGTDYEFRAVAAASDGDTDVGSTVTFSTESGSSTSAPVVDRYRVTEAGSPNPHAEITADWTVSDADADLDAVLVEVIDANGTVVAASRTSVSGGRASSIDQFKLKHRGNATYDVRLTVRDGNGHTASQTKTVRS